MINKCMIKYKKFKLERVSGNLKILKRNFTNYFDSTNTEIDQSQSLNKEQVTPWSVEGKINYDRLVKQFGTELIDQNLTQRIEKIFGEVHPWIRRGIFFSHRGLNNFINAIEKGEQVFLYTGRGPSSNSMHLGHLVPFIFTKWLHDRLKCPLVIQISDDEKCAIKQKKFEEIYRYGIENTKDIIACGFDSKRTFIFSNREYRLRSKSFELLATEMKNLTSLKEVKKIFGFSEENSVAMYEWPFYQTAAAYYSSYPHIFKYRPAMCLIPHAIDQDPYFRLSRDLSPRLNLPKPCSIMSKFLPPLMGMEGKMSSSTNQEGTIFLLDDEKTIRNKIIRYAYSGGGGDGSLADHKKYGGDPEKDISFQYLRYLEYDDNKLEKIRIGFAKGEISCGEMKILLLDKLIPLITEIQERRKNINQSVLQDFYADKEMNHFNDHNLGKNEVIKLNINEMRLYKLLEEYGINYFTKYHEDFKIIMQDKEKEYELKSSVPGIICKTVLLKAQNNDFILLVYNYESILNLKELKKKSKLNRLIQAEKDTVEFLFGSQNSSDDSRIKPDHMVLSMFSLINKKNNSSQNISIWIENSLKDSQFINFPPFRNDATTTISLNDAIEFIYQLGYSYQFIDL